MQKTMWIIIWILAAAHMAVADDCLKKQGALDIGSGSTKSVVAVVDVCKKTIAEVISEENMAVPFAEALEQSADGKISDEFIKKNLPRYSELAERMKRQGAVTIYSFGTAVFRNSRNGQDILERISRMTGGPVQVITQDEEARLGYWSAVAKRPPKKNETVIVWDIGGGSMQMIRKQKEKFEIYRGDLAAVNFKNRVLSEVQKKDPKKHTSPNPLNESWKKAVEISAEHARTEISRDIRSQASELTWLGIGGVLYNSVREQIGTESIYTAEALQKTLERKAKMSDSEIGGEYAATDVTNLALVAGYMQALKIKQVEAVRASMPQGWLLYKLDHP